MKVLTTKYIKRLKPCKAGLRKFQELFGDGMKVTLSNTKKLAVWGTTRSGEFGPWRIADVKKSEGTLIYWFLSKHGLNTAVVVGAVVDFDYGDISRKTYVDLVSRETLRLLKEME